MLIVAIAGQIFALISVSSRNTAGTEKVIAVALTLLGVLLIVSVVLRTHYTVLDERIRIVSGPFHWTVAISEITDIRESRSVLSSSALSLDRLKISYGHNRRILVSPANKKGFLEAIEKNSL